MILKVDYFVQGKAQSLTPETSRYLPTANSSPLMAEIDEMYESQRMGKGRLLNVTSTA